MCRRVILVETDVSEGSMASSFRVKSQRINNTLAIASESIILYSHRRENLKSYNLTMAAWLED
jgi:hypothetical protein